MADKPTASEASSRVTRRSFLRASALGAGAAALPLGACAATPPIPGVPDGGGGGPSPDALPIDHWVEPAVWDVGVHGDRPLPLTVMEIDAPSWLHVNAASGGTPANPAGPTTLFTYNGSLPGPTIRMGGDDVLRVQLVNALSGNNGTWAHDNGARFAMDGGSVPGQSQQYAANDPVPDVPDWVLSRNLLYGPHMQHTTNLHTHGLHVRPGPNPAPPGAEVTHSDNVMLRVIPDQDYHNRMAHVPPIPLSRGLQGDPQHVEVPGAASYEFRIGSSSGAPTHPPGTHWYHPHPHGATYDQVVSGMAGFLIVEGDVDEALAGVFADAAYNYRERLMLFQRVFDTATAPIGNGEGNDEGGNRLNKNQKAVQTVNGQQAGTLGFTMQAGAVERWRVLNGSVDGNGYVRFAVAPAGVAPPTVGQHETPEDYNARLEVWARQNGVAMMNVAFDGVTLVSPGGDYTAIGVDSLELGPANRADFLFQAPQTAGTYNIWGVAVTHRAGDAPSAPTAIASLTVTARPSPPAAVPLATVQQALGALTVPDHLLPISAGELMDASGQIRSRQVIYSGWGGNGYPQPCNDLGPSVLAAQQTVPPGFSKNSMAISRVKYDPNKPVQLMGLDTAEEWVLDNYSIKTDAELPLPSDINTGAAVDHPFHMHQNPFYVLAILRPDWSNVPRDANGKVPLGAEPEYVNVLPTPRWQDVVPIPNDGGRVVFRSRFPDYHGFYVNHCHILQHEDWGMMQAVEVIDPTDPAETRTPNYNEHAAPYDLGDLNPTTGQPAYPKPTVREMLSYCQTFLDLDGQVTQGGRIQGATSQDFCSS